MWEPLSRVDQAALRTRLEHLCSPEPSSGLVPLPDRKWGWEALCGKVTWGFSHMGWCFRCNMCVGP